MSQVRNIIGGIVAFGMSLLNPACTTPDVIKNTEDRERVLTEIMTDRPQTELDAIYKEIHNDYGIKAEELQHKIDSVAFKDMFEGTQLVKDSNFVAEYNEMMTKTRVPYCNDFKKKTQGRYFADNEKMTSTLHEMVTVGEMQKLNKSHIMPGSKLDLKRPTSDGLQYYIDSIANSKLFEKYGLLDSAGMDKFSKICKKVRP